MAKELIQQFQVVNDLYQTLLQNRNEAFEEIKKINKEKIEELEKEMLLLNIEWKEAEEKLMRMIENKSSENGIIPKITELVNFYTVEEKEIILYQLEESIQSYRALRVQMMMCEEMAFAQKETTDTLIDVIVHTMREEGDEKKTIINRKM